MASEHIGGHLPEGNRIGEKHRSTRSIARLGSQILSVTLSALLILQPVAASAGGKLTPAGGGHTPTVGAAPNGVPLVDIVKPNGKGLSHNTYKDFNVDKPGLILNNSDRETATSNLGGVTPGNPSLVNSGPATVILNEVTSNNRSAVNGPVEVFGRKADVIIANPNGITCDGCGFINTPRATLTTGVPDIDAGGRLQGFTVNRGDVTFGSKGGNFASGDGAVDLFDVVSRSIKVDGPVYGKDIRLTAGRNAFAYATGTATALEAKSGAPEFAIDGSALGAMQADRIKIVVTEKGAGVRMRGNMAANVGELSLSSDGKISIGNASGKAGVNIRSKAKVEARKTDLEEARYRSGWQRHNPEVDCRRRRCDAFRRVQPSVDRRFGDQPRFGQPDFRRRYRNGRPQCRRQGDAHSIIGRDRRDRDSKSCRRRPDACRCCRRHLGGIACQFRHYQPECRARS